VTGQQTVIGSPLFASFAELARQGFTFALWPDGTVQVRPIDRLPAHARVLMRQHPEDLRLLVSVLSDPDLQARRTMFDTQLQTTTAPRVPAFLFTPDVPYTKGHCFSCGDALTQWRFGRCWRCSLAWRLVCHLSIEESLAKALDDAKVVA
jgi:hypothetical protein